MTPVETIMDYITRFGNVLLSRARLFTLKDALDVAIVTVLLYGIIKLVRDTRAGQLVKGIILLVALYLLSFYGELLVLNEILKAFLQSAVVIVVILFQPEIRKALEQVGRSKTLQTLGTAVGVRDKDSGRAETRQAIAGVVEATGILQQLRMGALIIFERSTRLGEIIETGALVDAGPSGQLIANIFFNKAPLHDGGMIIREGRICAAGCILPLTSSTTVSAELGTRHRAALGMSENSDAVVVVVSEETGQISIALGGRLTRNYTRLTLTETLEELLIGEQEKSDPAGHILGRLGIGRAKKR
ncbi:diadenylate cyclase CdaA [Acutalibacter intestini]|uniref:diadenylate cyclase CdaA n=1 Tax=Acutalibacter intestini TaxID=3093659 RepID=UPI002AC94855|nr:diadenylate cyclase CdaA [Acutalibacter sp. M00204]